MPSTRENEPTNASPQEPTDDGEEQENGAEGEKVLEQQLDVDGQSGRISIGEYYLQGSSTSGCTLERGEEKQPLGRVLQVLPLSNESGNQGHDHYAHAPRGRLDFDLLRASHNRSVVACCSLNCCRDTEGLAGGEEPRPCVRTPLGAPAFQRSTNQILSMAVFLPHFLIKATHFSCML